MNWILYNMGDEINRLIEKESQWIFNVLYVGMGITATISSIICWIGAVWSKNNPDRRKLWIQGAVAVIICTVAGYLTVAFINGIITILESNYRKNSNIINYLFGNNYYL